VYRLDTNYRSTPSLVAAANQIFKPLFSSGADGNPVGFEPVRPGRTEQKPGAASPGPAVTFIDVESRNGASEAIVAAIREILEPGPRQAGASDIAVLVRGEEEENDIFRALEAAGIPAVRFRTRSVFTSPQVSSLDALLCAMDRPRDISFWKAVLSGRYFRIPPAMLLRFEDNGHLDGFVEEGLEWQRLFTAGRSMEAFDSFFRYGAHTADWAEASGDAALSSALRTPWPRRVLAEPDGLRQWQDWRHLSELIQNRQAAGISDIQGIRSWLAESASEPDPESSGAAVRLETEAPAVRVMTMHSAKGLEFPLVFLHGGYRGKTSRMSGAVHRFDQMGTLVVDRLGRESTFRRHLAYEWEEDKRLWYVAFTRASERLMIPLVSDGHLTLSESVLHQALLSPGETDAASGTGEPVLPPHQIIAKRNAGEIKAAVRRRIRDLAVSSPEQFAMAEGAAGLLPPLTPAVQPPAQSLQPPRDVLSLRDPFTGSYTSLVRSAGSEAFQTSREADDRDTDGHTVPAIGALTADAEEVQASPDREPLLLSADRGALFGTLVHSFFEGCDFRKAGTCSAEDWSADPEVEELFSKLTRRCYPPDWYRPRARALKSMVFSTLSANLDSLGRLCDIPEDRKRAEVEFLISIPRDGTLDAGELRLASRRGFLKGYIDLLVEHDGRWWVVDWKTNLPPPGRETAEAYVPSCLDEIMDYHHYHLQYELYLLALCRTLSANGEKPVDWDSQIGGAAYLFVRGTRPGDNRGVFTRKPSLKRMHELASAMGLEGVIR
jgi:exodeoxyribonuclease V beta subunit